MRVMKPIAMFAWTLLLPALMPVSRGGELAVDNLCVTENAVVWGDLQIGRLAIGGEVTNGLILRYTFDEPGDAVDGSGQNNTGLLYEGPLWTSNGLNGGGMTFDGVDDYLESSNALGVAGSSPWTMALWVRLNDVEGNCKNIMSVGQEGSDGYVCSLGTDWDSSSFILNLWGSQNVAGIDAGADLATNFAFMVVSFDGAILRAYVNGSLRYSGDKSMALVDQPVRIGGRPGGYDNDYYHSEITVDDVRVYDRALSLIEILSLYYAAAPVPPQPATLSAGAVLVTNRVLQSSPSATNVFMGRMGIGTAAPAEALHVGGKLQVDDNIKLNGHWLTHDGDNEGVFVATNGFVGIGTNNPSDRLHVNGRVRLGGNLKLSGYWLSNDGDNEGINVTTIGRVGVGISGPISRMHLYESTTNLGANAGFTIEQAGGGDAVVQLLLTGVERRAIGIDRSDSNKFKIGRGANWATGADLTIDSTGKVGIGTSAPTEAFHVVGPARFDQGIVYVAPLGNLSMGSFTNSP